jgi:hypothetical protein
LPWPAFKQNPVFDSGYIIKTLVIDIEKDYPIGAHVSQNPTGCYRKKISIENIDILSYRAACSLVPEKKNCELGTG